MYAKTVNNTREDMIAFLTNHFRYNTMNLWNQSTSYANNVKIPNLNLPSELIDKAYDFLCVDDDYSSFQISMHELINDFRKETGYDIGFNGRSAGYLVLYYAEYDRNTGKLTTYPGRNIDMDADFEDWPDEALIDRMNLVCRFDKLCDEIRDVFIDTLRTYDIVEETVMVPKTVRVLKKCDS